MKGKKSTLITAWGNIFNEQGVGGEGKLTTDKLFKQIRWSGSTGHMYRGLPLANRNGDKSSRSGRGQKAGADTGG